MVLSFLLVSVTAPVEFFKAMVGDRIAIGRNRNRIAKKNRIAVSAFRQLGPQGCGSKHAVG